MQSNARVPEEPKKQPVVASTRRHHIRLLVVVLVCCLVGVGFYRGWFAVSSRTEPETHKVDVNLTVDTEKIKEDAKSKQPSDQGKSAPSQ
jgi:cell division septal protein FtsQ